MRPPEGPTTYLNAARRRAELDAIADGERLDLLVIGGGVTGAGVALDAATRGLKVALLERRQLATGTSRWSSKLAHGGLRYLAQGNPGVAWESARERQLLATYIAPHLIRALPQLTPASALFETGIRLGDGMRALAGTSRERLPCARRISSEEAQRWAPATNPAPAILHWDGQLEDDARLVIAIARTAAAHGAQIITYAEVDRLTDTGGDATDVVTGNAFSINASHVINATGVWADRLVGNVKLRPSRGAHILVDAARLGDPRASINIPIPGHFGRFVFAIPRTDGLVMIGLTDDPHEGTAIPDAPQPTERDIDFLLETSSTAFPMPLTRDDVVGSFAGLRPLLDTGERQTADISREHTVTKDPETNAVTIVGGKLTTYRRMAQDAVDAVSDLPCRTQRLPLVGAAAPGTQPRRAAEGVPARLRRRYGAEAEEIAALAARRPELLEPIAPGLPALAVEVVVAVEREGALTSADVLDVHTRLGLVPTWRAAALHAAESFTTPAAAAA
ncbi:MAG TPA: glycerol-3-phosphate dehydrogenase/oxidase [Solirubrobacteraceae bacterium]|jgi:glycerol-3-phosphate dehydrogenase|nr:glycerol-3-phosphate dehydrogenase/oxidase [Solirubrobacteraceae bacterium]